MKTDTDFDWIYTVDQFIAIIIMITALPNNNVIQAILALGLIIKNEFAHDRKLRKRV